MPPFDIQQALISAWTEIICPIDKTIKSGFFQNEDLKVSALNVVFFF